uniref:Chromosome 18 open reading frame 21 n=1 Tax=Leptobrachium leishanense TaxID=445787 RepID=A0A8C5PTH4_9ANUR
MNSGFLQKAAFALKDSCPGLSRHYLSLCKTKPKAKKNGKICPFCFQILSPDDFKVRLRPKLKITPRIERILRKEAKNYRLNLKQTKLLRKYKFSRSVLVVTCNTCKMASKYPGECRSNLGSSTGTPKVKRSSATSELRAPGSARKVNLSYSEEKLSKSPVVTPRSCASAQSSPATLPKSAKKGKFKFSRLKLLLNQETKETAKKADLQSFLSSLR